MSDLPTTTGSKHKQRKNAKASTPEFKPSEPSSQKSNLPHQQMQAPKAQPRTEMDKRNQVASLLRGEEQTTPHDRVEPNEPDLLADVQSGSASADPKPNDSGTSPLLSDGEDGAGLPFAAELPETFDPKFLAEQLGIKPEELYNKLQITTQNGDTLTFGEWKDRVTDQATAAREIIAREQQLEQRESATNATMQLLSSIGEEVTKQFPQAAQMLAQHQKKVQASERRLAMNAMPELADKATRDQFRDDIAEHLSQYGFRASELNIVDHRILLALKDAMKTKARLDKLLSFDPEANSEPPRTQRPQGKRKRVSNTDQLVANAKNGTTSDKVAAVGALLRGK